MNHRRSMRVAAILLVALAIPGLGVADQDSLERRSEKGCRIFPRAAQAPPSEGVGDRGLRPPIFSFSATEIEDIELQVRFPPLEDEDHLLSVRVLTPRQHLYQQIDVPFSARVSMRSTMSRRVDGYPRPLKVQAVQEIDDNAPRKGGNRRLHQVSARLPVAGTLIMQNSLYGLWTAEALLDGEAVCGTITFDIRE